MDIKDLNKSQLILLVILICFVISIATSIMTVTLMQEAPIEIVQPINKVIQQTIEKVVTVESSSKSQSLSKEQLVILDQLKALDSLSVTISLIGTNGESKILGKGYISGDNRVIISPNLPDLMEGEQYMAKSILGEQKVIKITQEKNYTIVEIEKIDSEPAPDSDQVPVDPNAPQDGTPVGVNAESQTGSVINAENTVPNN